MAKNIKNSKKIVIIIILIVFSLPFILPLFWMVTTSLKVPEKVFTFPPEWIPSPVKFENYALVFDKFPFLRYLRNTLLITIPVLIGTVLSSAFVAFSFARLKWPGRNIFFVILLSTMMLPTQVTMIPVFIIFKKIGWIDTFLPLTIPAFLGGGAFNIFLLRQFFLTIPDTFEESAKIDGANLFQIFYHIILPLSKPVLMTVAIFTFIGVWNDFMGPLIYLSSAFKKTLTLGLQIFLSEFGSEWNLLMAASTLVLLPCIIIFFIGQKYFVRGIVMSGLKG